MPFLVQFKILPSAFHFLTVKHPYTHSNSPRNLERRIKTNKKIIFRVPDSSSLLKPLYPPETTFHTRGEDPPSARRWGGWKRRRVFSRPSSLSPLPLPTRSTVKRKGKPRRASRHSATIFADIRTRAKAVVATRNEGTIAAEVCCLRAAFARSVFHERGAR